MGLPRRTRSEYVVCAGWFNYRVQRLRMRAVERSYRFSRAVARQIPPPRSASK
jgi:hypothetical protein